MVSIPDNCHNPHNLGWCTFFKPAYLFPQRTRKGLLLGKFIQRIKTQICTFFVMKILDKPSQILNVRNTTSQCHSHQVHQTKTKYPNQNTKYAKQDTNCANSCNTMHRSATAMQHCTEEGSPLLPAFPSKVKRPTVTEALFSPLSFSSTVSSSSKTHSQFFSSVQLASSLVCIQMRMTVCTSIFYFCVNC